MTRPTREERSARRRARELWETAIPAREADRIEDERDEADKEAYFRWVWGDGRHLRRQA